MEPEKYLTLINHFWFSFFHQAAHILFHSKKAVFLENANMSGDEETEADSFASNFLIPENEYLDFIQTKHFNRLNIEEFADTLGIAPGIVVGRLQHDRLIPFNRCNVLKRRFEWATDKSSCKTKIFNDFADEISAKIFSNRFPPTSE